MTHVARTKVGRSVLAEPKVHASSSLGSAEAPLPTLSASRKLLEKGVGYAKRLFFYCFVGILTGFLMAAESPTEESGVTFRAVDVYVDSKAAPLAAYQIEIQAIQGDVKIVGIEGGEHPAFQTPPFYDPKAMQQERVILAAFNTSGANDLPKGRTRVATVHYQTPSSTPARFTVKVQTAATVDTKKLSVEATVQERVSQ